MRWRTLLADARSEVDDQRPGHHYHLLLVSVQVRFALLQLACHDDNASTGR